ncbi:glycosyltransferase family 4 protein [Sphingomonas sp.]|uniref:glycosyltransferase family 4 protein n=1 Tax=Sphingomonas sp. TaxID=28214 RepID=UPI0025E5647E|nr:glycosyltransferase family 4 protein [Sphingomonas sp.]
MAHQSGAGREGESHGTAGAVRVAILLSDGLKAQGGIGRIMTYLTRALAAGHPEIKITTLRTRFAESGPMKHLTVPAALASFAVTLVRQHIQLVHINVAPRGSTWRKLLFEQLARRLGVPTVLHLHGSGYHEFYAGLSSRRQAAVRALFGRVRNVVVLGEFWQRFVIDVLGVAASRVVVIPNGVPAADPPVVRLPAPVPAFLFLGIVGHRKGIDVFLGALAELRARGIGWSAVVAGNGEVAEARATSVALGLDDAVDFLGWVDEGRADTLLRAADIFVLPSRAENQPVSILEAMARATPVISTCVGAIAEQVVDGTTALLVDPGDVAALANAMAALAEDPARAVAMGVAGRARFEQHFSVEACAARFATLYHAAVA